MSSKPQTLENIQHVLCIYFPTHIYPSLDRGRGLFARLLSSPNHLATYRVNARTTEYMLANATAFLNTELAQATADILVPTAIANTFPNDTPFDKIIESAAKHTDTISLQTDTIAKLAEQDYDLIILLYADPVGIGWNTIENTLQKLNLAPIAILNGRKRFFWLTKHTHKELKFRRKLERWWGAEILFTSSFFLSLPFVLVGNLLSRCIRPFSGKGWQRPKKQATPPQQETATASVQNWWTRSPMVYGQTHGQPTYKNEAGQEVSFSLGNQAFFEQVDESFYKWNKPLHNDKGPFARIYPYEEFKNKRVLEVGCGMGTMAMNWAKQGAKITPVDLTATAVQQTAQRLRVLKLPGTPCQAQAEKLPFPDHSFDYVYSWGVLHHTPNTSATIKELHRVLKPGGRVGVMLYSRQSLLYYFWVQFYEGWLHRESQFLDPVALASRYGDGAREEGNPHTWPITDEEVFTELFTPFDRVRIRRLGTELDNVFKRAMPGLGHIMPRFIKKSYARKWGWSVWIEAIKDA